MYDIFDELDNYVMMNYLGEDFTKISAYIERNFGKSSSVFHEKISKYVHTDILVTAPTAEKDYYTLVTVGMGSRKMLSPTPETDCIELVMYLSKEFDFNSEKGKYLVSKLVDFTKFPFRNDTYLGNGHTIRTPDINLDYFPFKSILLTEAKTSHGRRNASVYLPICNNTIKFYYVIPVLDDEYDYILNYGHEAFLKKLDKNTKCFADLKRNSVLNPVQNNNINS